MQAGRLYKNITFQILVPGASDGAGGTLPSYWENLLTTKCSFDQVKNPIVLQAMQFGTNAVYKVQIRKRSSFTPLALVHKAVIDGNEYVIQNVNSDQFTNYVLTLTNRT